MLASSIFALLGKAMAGAVITLVAAPALVSAVGFGSAGVAAGSMAALMQSWIGNVAAGSLFAALQSAGAAGIGSGVMGVLGTVGAAVGAALGAAL